MSDVADVKALTEKLSDDISFTDEACESLIVVPKLFRKMAIKTILKGAREEGVSEVDLAFAEKFKPGNV